MRHHDAALRRFADAVRDDDGVLAVLVNGSVARGTERPDSDVDIVLVVTDEHWARATADQRVMYVDREHADYEGGYLDVKLLAIGALVAGAERGDEPFRASLADAIVTVDRSGSVADLVAAAGRYPDATRERRMLSFLAQVRLQAGYFLAGAERDGDRLLLRSASVHAVLAASRALLVHAGRLYRGPKYLSAEVRSLERPDDWDALIDELLDRPTAAAGRRLIATVDAHCGVELDDATALSRYVADTEYAWWTRTPTPEYS